MTVEATKLQKVCSFTTSSEQIADSTESSFATFGTQQQTRNGGTIQATKCQGCHKS